MSKPLSCGQGLCFSLGYLFEICALTKDSDTKLGPDFGQNTVRCYENITYS